MLLHKRLDACDEFIDEQHECDGISQLQQHRIYLASLHPNGYGQQIRIF